MARLNKTRMAGMSIGGALLGAAVSWIVNCTLVEISLSTFFSFYFGLLFFMIGAVILWRVHSSGTTDNAKKPVLYGFSFLVFLSGALCFLLDEHMFTFSPTYKVPLYLLLGVSICFAFTFSAMDLINWSVDLCQSSDEDRRPLVETPLQVYLVLGTSIILGAVFGLIFGLMDVEDARGANLRIALLSAEHICLPIGLIVGGIAGCLNEFVGSPVEPLYGSVPYDDDNDGI